MLPFTGRAAAQIAALYRHYEDRDRLEAFRNLIVALREASEAIELDPAAGLRAPRSYPHLIRPGLFWVKAQRYWIGYRRHPRLIIAAVFQDRAAGRARSA